MFNTQLEILSNEDKKQICNAIHLANERTQLDMGEVKSQNSKHARFWDHLNTNLYDAFSGNKYLVKRGPWEMLILVKDGVLFTLMRTARFEEIKKQVKLDKNCTNYTNLLAKFLNKDVISSVKQECLFPISHEEESDEILEMKIMKFLCSVYENEDNITNHVIIIFEATAYGLMEIKQVIIDRNFDVAEEDNFSHLIHLQPSVTLDEGEDTGEVSETTAPVKLKLKGELKRKANS